LSNKFKSDKCSALYWSVYFRQNASLTTRFNAEDGWVVLTDIEGRIKTKIENAGLPLKDWDVQINYGIKTGFNEAFIIDSKTKEELIAKSPKNAEIIRPILKGRHIKKYQAEFDNQWIIFSRKGIDIEQYPAIKEHLQKYYKFLKPKETNDLIGRKPGNYQWYEIQDNVAYYKDFEKDKVIWLELTDIPKFAYDNEKYFIEATAFIMTGDCLKYLIAFLNSKICEWYFDKITTSSGVGTNRWKKIYLQNLPIPKIHKNQEVFFNNLVDNIISNKNHDSDIHELEKELEKKIYSLYNFTEIELEYFNYGKYHDI
jgi:hypothetical protein